MVNDKKLNKKQLLEDKKFTKTLIIRFGLFMLLLGFILVFFTYWCDTKFNYRKIALFGKEISGNLICMNGDKLAYHETVEFILEKKTFYACGEGCRRTITNHFKEHAFISDAFTGEIICKADAIIGLQERGTPNIVYFENIQNFKNFNQKVKRK